MASISLKNLAGEELGSVDVSDEVFAAPVNESLLHQAVVMMLANRRLGTHKAKTRGEVSGGGAKPWRQKGTGRARQGSRVSPLWRGGGIIFGPVPRGYSQTMPKNMRRSAMRSALSARLSEGSLFALDSFSVSEPKTKAVAAALEKLGIQGSVVIVDEAFENNAGLAVRNLRDVEMRPAASLNVVDILRPRHLVMTRAAAESIDARLRKPEAAA